MSNNDELINNSDMSLNESTINYEYVDEFGNPVDPSLVDEFGNYIGETEYIDENGDPIDPSLIYENGNIKNKSDNNANELAEELNKATNISNESAAEKQMENKELMEGMVTFDYNNIPITDIVNSLILDAINKGASDIHFDPFEGGIKIRLRVDGLLNDYSIVPLSVKKNMITRIKIVSGMNITESRIPQDGAIRTQILNKTIDIRVSCLPTNMGEKIVMRIMDYSMSASGIEALDFSENNLEKVKKMCALPNGIILVTGATGTGKSTTVYSILQRLNVEGTNLVTVEDPIEMNIAGINQVQTQSEIGLDFATILRSILRQDPDVIMIGEIRDDETARIAVRASITGHLVLSTIHTNNSLNTIERLLDMSVERYLLGSSLSGIISQKLSRRLCNKCKKLRPTTEYEKKIFKSTLDKDIKEIYEPVGCDECTRGYRGRIAIHEVLLLDQQIQDAITKGVDKTILRKLVYGNKTETMLQDGLNKVLDGKTSFEEILKLIDLDDDLGTGTELGLKEQIKDSHIEENINISNNDFINATKELISAIKGVDTNDNIINEIPTNNKKLNYVEELTTLIDKLINTKNIIHKSKFNLKIKTYIENINSIKEYTPKYKLSKKQKENILSLLDKINIYTLNNINNKDAYAKSIDLICNTFKIDNIYDNYIIDDIEGINIDDIFDDIEIIDKDIDSIDLNNDFDNIENIDLDGNYDDIEIINSDDTDSIINNTDEDIEVLDFDEPTNTLFNENISINNDEIT